ncbi:MAG: DUF2855 family protein [Pseudomonadota bacterium]
MIHIEVKADDLTTTRVVEAETPTIGPGEILVRVDRFALTANNITYAVFGERMAYWQFFPTEPGWGRIPVWGYANVAASNVAEIAVGERIYGYFPMGDTLVLKPTGVSSHGFVDQTSHRAKLPAIYNLYRRVGSGGAPKALAKKEALTALFEPLFTTSFLIDDFLADNGLFGATSVIVSSASSKTSLSLGFFLREGKRAPGAVFGLTSRGRVEFCRASGAYDEVLAYDEINALKPDRKRVYVDMSGNHEVRAALHHHFGAALSYDCVVGGTHWDKIGADKDLPGPKPELFFAPEHAQRRMGEWGPDGFRTRIAGEWKKLMMSASEWVEITPLEGPDAIIEAYGKVLAGTAASNAGYVGGFAA